MSCTHETFFTDNTNYDKCMIAKDTCQEDFDLINFFAFTYC